MSVGWIRLTRLGDRDERFVWHVRADQIAHYGRGKMSNGEPISYVGVIGQSGECDVLETVAAIQAAIANASESSGLDCRPRVVGK
jgi:diphthamide synthase subunit DPH2